MRENRQLCQGLNTIAYIPSPTSRPIVLRLLYYKNFENLNNIKTIKKIVTYRYVSTPREDYCERRIRTPNAILPFQSSSWILIPSVYNTKTSDYPENFFLLIVFQRNIIPNQVISPPTKNLVEASCTIGRIISPKIISMIPIVAIINSLKN